MRVIKKLVHKIIKCRPSAINTLFSDNIITYEWVLFGKFKIFKTFKNQLK